MTNITKKLRQKGWNYTKPFAYFRNKIKRFMDSVEKNEREGDDF
jgi:hypothetical protein